MPLTNYPLFNFSRIEVGNSLTQTIAPYFLDWLAHPNYDDYWKRWSIEDHFADINVPALHIVAWYDIFQGGSLRNYMGIKAHGGPRPGLDSTWWSPSADMPVARVKSVTSISDPRQKNSRKITSPSIGTSICSMACKTNLPNRNRFASS